MDPKILQRLCIVHEGGDGVEVEIWQDPVTSIYYEVPIEIVRDWDNIKPDKLWNS